MRRGEACGTGPLGGDQLPQQRLLVVGPWVPPLPLLQGVPVLITDVSQTVVGSGLMLVCAAAAHRLRRDILAGLLLDDAARGTNTSNESHVQTARCWLDAVRR